MKFYVYRHIRLDKNEPFYIGIGTKPLIFNTFKQEYDRAFSADGRNAAWLDIVIKSDYKVEIIFESDNYQEVKNKEYEFIQTYKSKLFDGGTLVNIQGLDENNDYRKEFGIIRKLRKGSLKENIYKIGTSIEWYDEFGNFVRDFKSIREAINTLKISSRILKQILNGVRPSFEGNVFKYKV